ncbi:uncharacterized protein LOC100899491 [Galendromus occidentalis]|uniref:Uncharacterized protein LOC100899491 n=1 Tax=Galendromus occidentalis TaxID=34638 RepID=A0AAJ6QPL2_9ACAR|nr:uncharacterized protein LOC100899491 [Galendromus occidentalis]
MDRHRTRLGLLPLGLLIIWLSSGADGVVDSEIQALLKQARADIMKMDTRKLTPMCRKVISKCRAKAIVLFQIIKSIQENPEPYLESTCLLEYLKNGIYDYDLECDMEGAYGKKFQCFRDPVISKSLGSKRAPVAALINCMAENSLNFDVNNPKHKF